MKTTHPDDTSAIRGILLGVALGAICWAVVIHVALKLAGAQ